MDADRSFEAWIKDQQSKPNHLDHKRLCDGYMYQSFGEDMDYLNENLEKLKPFLWTVFFSTSLTDDDAPWKIVPGYHQDQGRAGYLLAGIEWTDPNLTYYY